MHYASVPDYAQYDFALAEADNEDNIIDAVGSAAQRLQHRMKVHYVPEGAVLRSCRLTHSAFWDAVAIRCQLGMMCRADGMMSVKY